MPCPVENGLNCSRRRRQGRLPSRQPIAQERRQAGSQQLAATLNRSQRDWGVEGERSVVNQPRVTTGGGALPFPTGALPTHPLTPMARTIEQTAIRNFFMGPLLCEHLARGVCTAGKSPCGCISATHSQLRRGSRPLFALVRGGPARPPKADWLELLIQIAPRQATHTSAAAA